MDNSARSYNGNGSLPIWVRATAIVGIPGIIAMFLIWKGATDIARRADIDVLRARLESYIDQAEHNHHMLQQICANTAKDNVERAECFK